jgi:hypothetical protein
VGVEFIAMDLDHPRKPILLGRLGDCSKFGFAGSNRVLGIGRKTLWKSSHLFFSVTNWTMDFSYTVYYRINSGCTFALTHSFSNSDS